VGLALPTGTVLRAGDIIAVAAEWYLAVEARPEPVLAASPRDPDEAIRLAFEVGNRHFSVAIDGGRLLVPDDTAMEQLLERLGVPWHREEAVYDPVSGGHRHDPAAFARAEREDEPAASAIRKRDGGPTASARHGREHEPRVPTTPEFEDEPPAPARRPAALLSLLHFADSAFPTGGYTHSFGLERYCQAGIVTDGAGVERFLLAQIEGTAGPCDATAAVGEKTCYRVIVVRNDGQRSSYSNVACGTAAPLPPPPPPPTGGLIEKTFTYPGNLNTVYVVANGAYQCERQAGATHRLRIRRTSTGQILGEVSVENPTKNVPFVLGCEVTATGENAYLNRVKRLMAAP